MKIKVDENNTTVTNNVVNLVAINANDDRIACSLHLSSNKEDKDDLETVKYNQSVTVDLEVPNLILEINEYEEKSAFAIEVSSEGKNTNKISKFVLESNQKTTIQHFATRQCKHYFNCPSKWSKPLAYKSQ